MPTIQSEIIVHGSCQSLFNLTQDYTKRLEWEPFLKEARLLDGFNEIRVGVRAWCVSRIGIGMETEYVFIKDPNIVAVKMTKGPFILKNFAGSWRFIELDKSISKIIFRYYFSARIKVLEPVLNFILNREMKRRLVVLKMKYEENEIQ